MFIEPALEFIEPALEFIEHPLSSDRTAQPRDKGNLPRVLFTHYLYRRVHSPLLLLANRSTLLIYTPYLSDTALTGSFKPNNKPYSSLTMAPNHGSDSVSGQPRL